MTHSCPHDKDKGQEQNRPCSDVVPTNITARQGSSDQLAHTGLNAFVDKNQLVLLYRGLTS